MDLGPVRQEMGITRPTSLLYEKHSVVRLFYKIGFGIRLNGSSITGLPLPALV